jgi:hypothetical protein
MPVNNPVDAAGNAGIHDGFDLVDFVRGTVPEGSGQNGDSNHGAFPVLGQVASGARIEELRSFLVPAVKRHPMQRDGIAVLINDLVFVHPELAVNLDKARLSKTR